MCKMLNGIYELAVTAYVRMNMKETVFYSYCWMENDIIVWAEYMPNYEQ